MKSMLFLISILFCQVLLGQELAEWRGPGRTGVFNEVGLLDKWPEKGPELIWSVENLHKGYSSVSVANNTIYFTGISDTLDVLIAVSLDGKIKWQTPYGRARTKGYPDSRSTPTIEGGKAYVSSGQGDIACINAITGEIIWDLKAIEKYDGTIGRWGISESLLIVDDKLIYTTGGGKTNMIALNKNTGENIWSSESLNENPSYSSPLLIKDGDKQLIVSVTPNHIIGVSPGNGKIVWKFDNRPYAGERRKNQTNTPLYYENSLYITNGYNHKSVKLNLNENWESVSLAWVDTVLDVHHGGVVLVDGHIYGANWINNGQGNWCCINWDTGEAKYETKWKTKGSIISADGKLYCYEEKTGYIALVNVNPEKFEIISSFKVPLGTGPHWSHPVIHNGILYIRHMDALMAFNIKKIQ